MEPSPICPPVYRRYLAGGTDPLRLSPPDVLRLAAAGIVLIAIRLLALHAGGTGGGAVTVGSLWSPVLLAVLLSAFAARWLGSRAAAQAGLVYLTSMYALAVTPLAAAETPFCAAVMAALAAFALANVPGRMPLVEHLWTRCAFYGATGISLLLAGPAGPLVILSVCLLYVLVSLDPRGVRFLVDPRGIAVLLVFIAVQLALDACSMGIGTSLFRSSETAGFRAFLPQMLARLAIAGLPWTPVAVLAVAMGICQGHYATGVWRFFACWLVASLALGAVGILGDPPRLGILLPPVAAFGGAGLWSLVLRCRRAAGAFRWRGGVQASKSTAPAKCRGFK